MAKLAWRSGLGSATTLGMAAVAWALVFGVAHAGGSWLSRALSLGFRGHSANAIAHYSIDTGGGLVLDQSGRQSLLRFDDSAEVWALTRARGPRGDLIYYNDAGLSMLRTTSLGGVTVFTHRHPEGAAASVSGQAPPLRMARADPAQLYQRLVVSSTRASRGAQHLIAFQAPEVDANTSAVVADAAQVAAEAVAQLAATQTGHMVLARLNRFEFLKGKSADVAVADSTATVRFDAKAGFAGRPSSARIVQVLSIASHGQPPAPAHRRHRG